MKKIYVITLNLGYWLLIVLLIAMLYVATQINLVEGPSAYNLYILFSSFVIAPSLVAFYGSYFFLFRSFVKKVGTAKLVIYTVIVLLISSLIALLNVYSQIGSPRVLFEVELLSLMLSSFNIIIGFILHSFISWFTDIKEKEELTQKTKALELEMLKLKLDPHFLFNTINNIDVLIEEDSTKASEYIIKLSSILRFYLYKTSNSMIKLSDEIKYIQEYVDLQKIRTSNENFVNLTLHGKPERKEIAPMVFIPFIENAFKHSLNKKADTIDIHISVDETEVYFKCINSLHPNEKETMGIGNELIENRLKLIYGNTYDLKVTVSEKDYLIELKIPV